MRSLETKVAQLISTALSESIPVRVGEQLASLPQDKVVVVNMDSKRPKNDTFIDVFENTFKIQLRMHYADSTEEEMENAGKLIHFTLLDTNAWVSESDVLYHKITETKKLVQDDQWIEEYTYMVLAVDKES